MLAIDIKSNQEHFNQEDYRQVVVIDSALADYQSLSAGVLSGYEVVLLDSERDGVAQITAALNRYEKIDSVHIVSHGAPGCLYLGKSQLSLDTLPRYQKDLALWFAAQGKHTPSLVLYGCNVAAGDAGEEFLAKLRVLTQANIAASMTKTGNSALEGNWNLEARLGKVDAALPFKPETVAAYPGVLMAEQIFNINPNFDSVANANESNSGWDPIDDEDHLLVTDDYARSGNGLNNNGIYDNSFSPRFELAYASGDGANSNYLLNYNRSRSFTLPSNQRRQYSEIHLAATATEGSTTMQVTKNYTDGTSSTYSVSVPDWFSEISNTSSRYYLDNGMDRVQKGGGFFGGDVLENANDPAIFGFRVETDPQKTLQSVRVTNQGGTQNDEKLVVLGATGVYDDSPTVANTISQQTTEEDSEFDFTVPETTFSDPDGDQLTYTATLADDSLLPDWLSFDSATRTFSGIPDNTEIGTISVKVTATDPDNQSVSTNFELTVTGLSDQTLTVANEIADQTAIGSQFSFTVPETTFNDSDGDVLSYSASLADDSPLPGWLSFDPATRTFNSTSQPPAGTDSLEIKVIATDNKNLVSDTFNLALGEIPESETDKREFRGKQSNDNILGGSIKDIIRGARGNDVIAGNAGADRLFGDEGDDALDGGDDNDFLQGGTGNDYLTGGEGIDFLLGETGQDTLTGGEGDDFLMGGDDSDTLDGGVGADRMGGFAGDDVFVVTKGDTGNIIYDFEDNSDRIALELSSFDNGTVNDIMNNELTITQSGTNVEIISDSQTLATVYNVNTGDLTNADFTTI